MAEDIQTSQLEAFLAVVRAGSISAAAGELMVSQPTVTARIHGLERGLSVNVFDRSPSGSRINAAGKALLPHAERSMTALATGRRAVADIAAGFAGHLTIAATRGALTSLLPVVLGTFREGHPRVQVSLQARTSADVLEMVVRGEVDLGIMRRIHHDSIDAFPLYTDRTVLVVHRNHPLTTGGRVSMRQLAGERWVLLDRANSYRAMVNAIFHRAGIEPLGYLEVDNAYTAGRMVQQGIGIAFLPLASVRTEVAARLVAIVDVIDAIPIEREIVVARRRDVGLPSSVASAFMRTVQRLHDDRTIERPPADRA